MTRQRGEMAIPTDTPKFATLAQHKELPPRVRALLEGLLDKTGDHFHVSIVRTLDELDSALFKLAGRSSSNAQQQEHFDNLRELKLRRADIAPRFLQHVEATLAGMRERSSASQSGSDAAPHDTNTRLESDSLALGKSARLELVDASILEEDLALQEVASKSEIRNSQALYALSHRLGVIAGKPAWPNETLPLGPAQLVAAFRGALREVKLGVEARVMAYRQFDRISMLALGAFYESLNGYLVAQRVLPNLQWQAGKTRGPDAGPDPVRDTLARHVEKEALAQESTADEPTQSTISDDVADSELFRTLRKLLSDRRNRHEGGSRPWTGNETQASRDDLQSVLGLLQHSPDARAKSAEPVYDSGHFKEDLLTQLRRAGPHGDALRLGDEDADTVDLIGLLFDYITTNVRAGSGARSLLSRLRVPVLRVALGDKTFFTRRNHPARELLNTIAETGERWFDESDSDPDLSHKMQLVVDSVSNDFDGNLSVFENLLADLGKHMQLLARRAEVAERRHIDAAKGRDKLEIARETARGAITRVIQGGEPTPLVRALLEQAWTDALALSALRHGAGSEEFKRRLGIALKLARGPDTAAIAKDESLRRELDTGLRQIGLHSDDISGVVGSVFAPADSPQASNAEQFDRVDALLKGKVRFGGEASRAPAEKAAPIPLNAAERAEFERIRSIPFGTWFDFVQNQQGATVRRKLAWFSTVTGHCLFVTQRGARSGDYNLEQLARDMARGQARIAVAEKTSLIDRAWKAIVDTLRLHGDNATEAPA